MLEYCVGGNMLYISLENQKIKNLKKLQKKKYRDQFGMFLVEGKHLVKEAYNAGVLIELFISEDSDFSLDVETSYLSDNIFSFLSEVETSSKVIGLCKKIKTSENIGNRILVLDDIQDPGNLGTIIRSSVAFNVDTIVLGLGCVDLYNPKVVRSSQGMIFHINIIEKNILDYLPQLKQMGYHIYGTKVTGENRLKDIEKNDKTVIIMGNEALGVKTVVLDLCDDYIHIPMNQMCESLNVGVATSIILYELDK